VVEGTRLKRALLRGFLVDHKLLIVIALVVVLVPLRTSNFLTAQNILGILSNINDQGIIVIGMALLIIVGEIDLSVGSTMAFGAVLAILFQPYGVLVGVLASLAGGSFVGLVNGLFVTRARISSLGATLGSMIFLNGIVFALTKEHTIIGSNESFSYIAQAQVFGIPISVIGFLLLVVLFEIILQKTILGRSIFAIGGNATASRLFGIRVERIRVLCFVLTGFLSGLAGTIVASKLNVASGTLGTYTPILVITAALLGGTSLLGGEGSIVRAFEGILLIGLLNNAMVLLGISPFIQQMIQGLLLIFIVAVDAASGRKKRYA
jgi:ribose/xylose/arabinose/galactoside ABC-type transport system permease subunit